MTRKSELLRQLDRIHTAIDEQQAHARLAERRRQEEARIRAAVDDARRRFAKGEHQAALQSLLALQPASNALVAGTLEELQLAFREIEEERRLHMERLERRRRVATLLEEGRLAIQDQRLDDAAQVLERLRGTDAMAPELSDLAERVRRAQGCGAAERGARRHPSATSMRSSR